MKKEGELHFIESGSGFPIVLLHGFLEDHSVFDAIVPGLNPWFRVICPDFPGHGESPVLPGGGGIENYAEALNKATANLPPFVLLGHSMGGYISLAFAEKFPDRLVGLGLIHSTAAADSDEKKADRDRAIEIVKQDRKGFITGLVERLFAPGNRERCKPWMDRLKLKADQFPEEGIVSALKAMKERPDRVGLLARLTIPFLMVTGKEDELIQPDKVEEQKTKALNAHYLSLEKSGHMGMLEEPIAMIIGIRDFAHHCFFGKK